MALKHRVMAEPIRSLTLLATDPGAKCGLALFHRGQLITVRGCNPFTVAPTTLAQHAQLLADRDETELMVVGEDWGVGGFANPTMMVGLAQSWGIVKREMMLVGTKDARVWRIPTATWRSFYGGPIGQKYFDWKKWAVDNASERAGFSITNDNAAEAFLIGYAALRLPETLDRVTKRARKRHDEYGPKSYLNPFPQAA